jgi:hypothetical protein
MARVVRVRPNQLEAVPERALLVNVSTESFDPA